MTETTESPKPRTEEADPRINCFVHHGDNDAFETSVVALMGRMQDQSRKMFVSEHNVLRMNHGSTWVHAAHEPKPETSMHTISVKSTIPFKDIAENDLSLIGRTILPINEEMDKQFAENMYGVVGAAAEKVGNVVNAQAAGSFGNAMLEMFQKIELSVNRDGNVEMPQMHVGTEFAARLPDEISKVPPEIEAEIERVQVEKTQVAFDREAERKAKFKRPAQ